MDRRRQGRRVEVEVEWDARRSNLESLDSFVRVKHIRMNSARRPVGLGRRVGLSAGTSAAVGLADAKAAKSFGNANEASVGYTHNDC